MALHEFDPSEVCINTSHPNRLSRPLIRTDTSLDRESSAFHCIDYQLSRHRDTLHTTASVASCRDTVRRCIPLHPLPAVVTSTSPVSKLRHPWDSMEAARFPHALSWDSMEAARFPHALCRTSSPYPYSTHSFTTYPEQTKPYQFSVPVPHTNVADKNRYYTFIHHVSRTDQNCAVLKRAENIMRHVEMWSGVRQKETDVLRVAGFSHKIVREAWTS